MLGKIGRKKEFVQEKLLEDDFVDEQNDFG